MNKKLWFRNFLYKLRFWIKLLILSPGVVVHELAHAFFCIITGTKIYKMVIFQFSEVAGYVEHQRANDIVSAFLISFGPLFLNTVVAFVLFQKTNLDFNGWKEFIKSFNLESIIFLYLGISISLSAIPSDADGSSFGEYIKLTVSRNFLWFPLFIFYPVVWILNLMNYLKRFKFDYILMIAIFYFALFY